MIRATISKWGNSKGIRLNQAVLQALNATIGDQLNFKIEDNKVIMSKQDDSPDLTFEELFKDYSGQEFDTEIKLPDERKGNEKW